MKKTAILSLIITALAFQLNAQPKPVIQKNSIQISSQIDSSIPKIWLETVNSTSIGLYEKFEITIGLDSASYTNPYDPDQIDIRAVFTSPSGKMWNIFGFYDNYLNANQWKVRFAPNEIGDWTYYLTAKDAHGMGQSETYQLTAIEASHHGWIQVSDDNPRYLEHDDGTTFYGVGMCYPWNVSKSGLSRLASFGANIFFYWNGTYDGAGNGGGRNLIESINSGLGRYDQHKSARMDELIDWSEELNIGMILVIWPHDYFCDQFTGWPKGWQSNPYKNICAAKDIYGNQQAWEYQKKQYRYTIARWGYSRALAGWQIICEISGTDGWEFGSRPVAEAWSQNAHDYFKTNDPFNRPTTGSQHGYVTNDWPRGYEIFDLPNREIYEAQGWSYDPNNRLRSSYQIFVRITKELWNGYQKPPIIGETGYSNTYVPVGTPEYVQLYHNALWSTLATGMAGTPFWWAYGSGNIVTEEVLQRMKAFSIYVKNIDFAHTIFTPAEVSANTCDVYGMKSDSLAFGWIRHIDNMNVSGQSFTLKGMTDGAYFIKWFDTWTGNELQTDLHICFNKTISASVPKLSPGQPDIAFTILATEPGDQPAALKLFADKTALFNDTSDTANVTCVIKDEQGRFCLDASNEIQLDIEGGGRILEGNIVKANNGIVMVKFVPDSLAGISKIIATSAGLISDTIEIEIKNSFTIDDFEMYGSTTHLQSYWIPYSGTQTSISLDPQIKNSGSYGLKIAYSIGAPVFAGIYRKIEMDWSRFSGIKLWIKPDGSVRTLAMMIKENSGNIWQFEYILSGTETTTLIVPFQVFKLYLGSGDLDLSAINQLIFYITKGSGSNGSGTIYLDDIEVLTSLPTRIESSDAGMTPGNFDLFQNYPNPFNSMTAISYQLSAFSQVELTIFDLLGKKVFTLVNEKQPAGYYRMEFDASDLVSGIYFYQINAGNFVRTRKMIVLQ